MPDLPFSRRDLFTGALGAGAFFLLPRVARAELGPDMLGPEEPFSFDSLKELARNLAGEDFTPMRVADAPTLERIDYDAHGAIRFREDKALWGGTQDRAPVHFFYPGRYFKEPVHIYALEDGMAREVRFSNDLFEIPEDNPARELDGTEGFAGFSVQDPEQRADWMAFLGASYWRTAGYSGQFGLSARGLALDTAIADGPEEFPRFTRFWVESQPEGAFIAHALLESPRATGAYRITSHRRHDGIVQDIEAQVFLRDGVERLGIAPLTSMFWFGKHNQQVSPDWRPEVHDSDGLEIHLGTGERLWRPLNNPPRATANSFQAQSPTGFGLMQRERNFSEYLDDGVFYDKRASAWIEPQGDWGEGTVTLIELPTDDEIHDNIVAFWTPGQAAEAGSQFDFAYRLSWVEDTPVAPEAARYTACRIGAGGVPGQPRPEGVVKVVCDLEPRGFEGLEPDPEKLLPMVTTSRGEVSLRAAYPVVGADYWRAIFDLDLSALPPGDDTPVDLRVYVDNDGTAMTETLVLQLFPSQLRDLLEAST